MKESRFEKVMKSNFRLTVLVALITQSGCDCLRVSDHYQTQVVESRQWGKGLAKAEFVQRCLPGESYPRECDSRMVGPSERPSDKQTRPTKSLTGGKAQGVVSPAECLEVRKVGDLVRPNILSRMDTGELLRSALGKLSCVDMRGDCGSMPGARTRLWTVGKDQLGQVRDFSKVKTNKGRLSGVREVALRQACLTDMVLVQTEERWLTRNLACEMRGRGYQSRYRVHWVAPRILHTRKARPRPVNQA